MSHRNLSHYQHLENSQHQSVDGLLTLFTKANHDLTTIQNKLEREFQQVYPDNVCNLTLFRFSYFCYFFQFFEFKFYALKNSYTSGYSLGNLQVISWWLLISVYDLIAFALFSFFGFWFFFFLCLLFFLSLNSMQRQCKNSYTLGHLLDINLQVNVLRNINW